MDEERRYLLQEGIVTAAKELGSGSYGAVYTCEGVSQPCAIKCSRVDVESNFLSSIKEIDMLRRCAHPLVVALLGLATDAGLGEPSALNENDRYDAVAMIIERGECNLLEMYKKHTLTFPAKKRIMAQLTVAVQWLHSLEIIHRDLKPENVICFYTDDPQAVTAKLCDFGMCVDLHPLEPLDLEVVSENYRAPEITKGQRYGKRSDVWSLGCIYYELATHECLFMERKQHELTGTVPGWKELLSQHAVVPEADLAKLAGLINKCVRTDPKRRVSSTQAMRDAFFGSEKEYMSTFANKVPTEVPLVVRAGHSELRRVFFQLVENIWKCRAEEWFSPRVCFLAISIFSQCTALLGDEETVQYPKEFMMAIVYISVKMHTERAISSIADIFDQLSAASEQCVGAYELLILSDMLNFRVVVPTLYDQVSWKGVEDPNLVTAIATLRDLAPGEYTLNDVKLAYRSQLKTARASTRKREG